MRRTCREYQASIDKHNQRLDEWNLSLNDVLSAFKTDGNKLLNQIADDDTAAQQARAEAFRQLVANATPNVGGVATDTDAASTQNLMKANAADAIPEINSPDKSRVAASFSE